MNKTAFIFVSILITGFLLSTQSYAASSTTTIINNISSSNSNSSSSNCHTTVHMETNGKTQDYESGNCGNVQMQSDNGSSTVHITNNASDNTTEPSVPERNSLYKQVIISPTILTPTISVDQQKIKDQLAKEKAKIEKQKKDKQAQQDNFLQTIEAKLIMLFSKFHFF